MTVAKPTYDLVLVRWWDNSDAFNNCWIDVENIMKLYGAVLIDTCGWLVREDDRHVYLSFSVTNHKSHSKGKEEDQISCILCIIKSCIESRVLIRKARKA